jgi:hypothetical protein
LAELVKAGYLTNASGVSSKATTTTGVFFVNLPHVPSVTLLYITFSATGSVNIQLKDGKSTDYIPIKTITANSLVKLAVPAATLACNITANTGTITIHYRTVVFDAIPNFAVEVFTAGAIVPQTITTTGTVTSTLVDVQKRLYGPAQPTTIAATLYTVPTAKKTTLELIHVVNTTASIATITLSIGADAVATRLLSAFSIPANGILTLPGTWSMIAAEVIQGLQGTSGALTIVLNGTETTV